MKSLLRPPRTLSATLNTAVAAACLLVMAGHLNAQQVAPPKSSPNSLKKSDRSGPDPGKKKATPRPGTVRMGPRTITLPDEFRTIDGTGNNLANPEWGSAEQPFLRGVPADYSDGVSTPAGANRPGAREISNAIAAQSGSVPNERGASDFVWQWGQFLDHDLDLTPVAEPVEPFDIPVPAGDPFFDPNGLGTVKIGLDRSFYEMIDGVREQFNEITAYIDASNVYGSDTERALGLRTNDGTGRLLTSPGDLLPFNTEGLPNAPTALDPSFFVAGDFRANEQIALTVMHTLFVREHNYWADVIRKSNPGLTGDQVYESARVIVGAEMQAITYNEFLPVLLGPRAIPRYAGYWPQTNAGIANEFATAAYRFGHSMLSPTLLRLDARGNEIAQGHLSLVDAFFNPAVLSAGGGIDPILRGLARQPAQEIDNMVIDEVRNFLFGPPGAGGFDLASLNLQRGRDHGLASYNDTRAAYGLRPATRWADITRDREVQERLASVYATPDDVDLWIGALCETHVRDAMVGETLQKILSAQFFRLRAGDRFWYQNHLDKELQTLIDRQTLAVIIRRNTGIGKELQDNVFIAPRQSGSPRGVTLVPPGSFPPPPPGGGGRR